MAGKPYCTHAKGNAGLILDSGNQKQYRSESLLTAQISIFSWKVEIEVNLNLPRSIQGCGVIKKGCGVAIQGCGVIKKGCDVAIQGCGVTKEGCGVATQGCGVTKEGCGVAIQGCGVTKEGCGVAVQGCVVTAARWIQHAWKALGNWAVSRDGT